MESVSAVESPIHSPGPFTCAGGGYIAIRDAGGVEIARVGCWNTKRTPDDATCEANASLFMAAPRLLAALKEVVAISDRKHDAWDEAKAAIAEASG